MKKFYYYSKFKIHPVDLKNYRMKFAGLVSVIFMVTLSLVASFYFVYSNYINPPRDLASLRSENLYLKSRLKNLSGMYSKLESDLDTLVVRNQTLRIAANLAPISNEEKQLATGGSTFGSVLDLISGKNGNLKETINEIDQVVRKFEYEKNNLNAIQSALAKNKELYRSIPALKPCAGELAAHGFGMRLHPILHIVRMHEGLDIITGIGTPVFAPADGVVAFSGYKNGLGLCIEVDHGYGYTTKYGHLSAVKAKEGQKISRGQFIGNTGNSGLSSGPHLHYEVLNNGTNIDPIQFFFTDNALFPSINSSKEE
ncbi:MAG: M23 family metallopeptidase [Ignavibacteriales bacterium]|nr:M23 family metallopeptidase [Ignavibacteriales bacterium]